MSLRVYVAGATAELGRARHWSRQLARVEGLALGSTWIERYVAAEVKGACMSNEERRATSRLNRHEVWECDVLWLLAPGPTVLSRDTWVELEAALCRWRNHAQMLPLVSGPGRRCALVAAEADEYATDEAAFAALEGMARTIVRAS